MSAGELSMLRIDVRVRVRLEVEEEFLAIRQLAQLRFRPHVRPERLMCLQLQAGEVLP